MVDMAILLNPSSVLLFTTVAISWMPTPIVGPSADPGPPKHVPHDVLAPDSMKVIFKALQEYKPTLYECPFGGTDHVHRKSEMKFVVNCESLDQHNAAIGDQLFGGGVDVKCYERRCVKVVHRDTVEADSVLCDNGVEPGILYVLDHLRENAQKEIIDPLTGEWWARIDSECEGGMMVIRGREEANAGTNSDSPPGSGESDHPSETGHRGRPLSRQGSTSSSASHSRSPSPSGESTSVNGDHSDQEGSVGSRGRSKTASNPPSPNGSPSRRSPSPPPSH